jgi:hypothetical protein
MSPEQITFWLTLAYGLAIPIIAVTYWRAYGPENFLWLSDIALAGTFLSLLTGSALLRCLSLFHLALPPTLLFLLYRFGYDERALALQTLLTLVVLAVTYLVTNPEKNINWVFGAGSKPQTLLPPLVYLGFEMVALPLFVFLPTHLTLKNLF